MGTSVIRRLYEWEVRVGKGVLLTMIIGLCSNPAAEKSIAWIAMSIPTRSLVGLQGIRFVRTRCSNAISCTMETCPVGAEPFGEIAFLNFTNDLFAK